MRRSMVLAPPIAVVLTAVAEIAVFVTVAHTVGVGWALLMLVGCSLVGGILVRREGVRAWRAFRDASASGVAPGRSVLDGLIGLGGALLLSAPGFLTSVAGLLLLLPPGRQLARAGAARWAQRRMTAAAADSVFGRRTVTVRPGAPIPDSGDAPADGEIVEGEIVPGPVSR